MAWLSVAVAFGACFLLYGTGHPILFGISILSVIIGIWTWGVMHNFAAKAAMKRSNYTGGFYDLNEAEAEEAPDWITAINLIFSIIGLIMLIIGIIVRFF